MTLQIQHTLLVHDLKFEYEARWADWRDRFEITDHSECRADSEEYWSFDEDADLKIIQYHTSCRLMNSSVTNVSFMTSERSEKSLSLETSDVRSSLHDLAMSCLRWLSFVQESRGKELMNCWTLWSFQWKQSRQDIFQKTQRVMNASNSLRHVLSLMSIETKSELVILIMIVCWLILVCDAFRSIRDLDWTFKSIEIWIALNDW